MTCHKNPSPRDDSKDNYYEDLGQIFSIQIPLKDFNAKLGREDILKLTIGL